MRDALTAAFARLLPEPLCDALELEGRHLHEIRWDLIKEADRLFQQASDLPLPNVEDD